MWNIWPNAELFSFDRLNTRLGKNIGGTINEMLEAKDKKKLDENNKFGSKTFLSKYAITD